MQPQQPYTDPYSNPYNNQYDFIMNPQAPQRRPVLNLNGGSMGMRIAVVAGGLVVLILIIVVVSSLFSGGGNVPNLTTVAEDQSEAVRVANLAVQDDSSHVTQVTTMNFAQNASLSIASDRAQLTTFLSSHGSKLSPNTLALKSNPATTQALSAAASSSTFDQAFLTAMQTDLETYASDLKQAYLHSQNTTEKQILSNDYNNEQLLMKQLTGAQSALQGANS